MASESGAGQTVTGNRYGVRTAFSSMELSRIRWEAEPKKVRVLYAKSEMREPDPEYLRTRGTRREDGGTILQA